MKYKIHIKPTNMLSLSINSELLVERERVHKYKRVNRELAARLNETLMTLSACRRALKTCPECGATIQSAHQLLAKPNNEE